MKQEVYNSDYAVSTVTDFNSFLRGKSFSYGVILRADEREIRQLQKYMLDNGYVIAFDKISTEKLFIHGDAE